MLTSTATVTLNHPSLALAAPPPPPSLSAAQITEASVLHPTKVRGSFLIIPVVVYTQFSRKIPINPQELSVIQETFIGLQSLVFECDVN